MQRKFHAKQDGAIFAALARNLAAMFLQNSLACAQAEAVFGIDLGGGIVPCGPGRHVVQWRLRRMHLSRLLFGADVRIVRRHAR